MKSSSPRFHIPVPLARLQARQKPDGLIIVVLFASTGVGVVDRVTVSMFIDTCGCFSVVIAPVSSDLTSSSNLPSKP